MAQRTPELTPSDPSDYLTALNDFLSDTARQLRTQTELLESWRGMLSPADFRYWDDTISTQVEANVDCASRFVTDMALRGLVFVVLHNGRGYPMQALGLEPQDGYYQAGIAPPGEERLLVPIMDGTLCYAQASPADIGPMSTPQAPVQASASSAGIASQVYSGQQWTIPTL